MAASRINAIPVFQIHFVSFVGLRGGFSSNSEYRERYPLTSQLIQENKIPEFGERYEVCRCPILISSIDNLYLDFNGIIHNCMLKFSSCISTML
jgi:XRN 5'-3' exonuclease N-terminus